MGDLAAQHRGSRAEARRRRAGDGQHETGGDRDDDPAGREMGTTRDEKLDRREAEAGSD